MLDRNSNLSFRMTQELGRAIVCGDYQPDESLPTEADLCDNYGVSRTVVREAVKMLSAKGLIKSKPRQGILIQPHEDWNIFDSDLLTWSLEGKPSLQVLVEFLEMRIALETEAAALAAKRNESARIGAIEDALERMKNNTDDTEKFMEADTDFHVSILYASRNRFYIRMRDFIRCALKVSISHTTIIKGDFEAIIEDHAKVLQAIKSGNAERAKNTMFNLIDEALSYIEEKLNN